MGNLIDIIRKVDPREIAQRADVEFLVQFGIAVVSFIYATFIEPRMDPELKLVIQVGSVVLAVFALHTARVKADLRRYVTRELVAELAPAQGRLFKQVNIKNHIDALDPGKDYYIDFSITGKPLIKALFPNKITTEIRMIPPLFEGIYGTTEFASSWRGEPISCRFGDDGSWGSERRITFDTQKPNPLVKAESSVTLKLAFLDDHDEDMFEVSLGKIPVNHIRPHQVLLGLIRLGALKKLPPGYNVLEIAQGYHTNLVFLPERLLRADEVERDRVNILAAAIARFIYEEFRKIEETHRAQFRLTTYNSDDYESEINSHEFLDNTIRQISIPHQTPANEEVLVALYQTPKFMNEVKSIRAKGGYGICLFGFNPILPQRHTPFISGNLKIIFNLSELRVAPVGGQDPCHVPVEQLDEIADSSTEYFQKYAPKLLAQQVQQPLTGGSPSDTLSRMEAEARTSDQTNREFEEILADLQEDSPDYVKYGRFVTSEPATTSHWINLAIFERQLRAKDHQSSLKQAIDYIVTRCIRAYAVDIDKLHILNLCSEGSGIADELTLLRGYKYLNEKIHTDDVTIARDGRTISGLHKSIVRTDFKSQVILLIPLDSYVNAVETVLEYVRPRENDIICVISIFSIVRTWEYLTANDFFDILPLFRIDPTHEYEAGLKPLTSMTDYLRLRPWLFEKNEFRI